MGHFGNYLIFNAMEKAFLEIIKAHQNIIYKVSRMYRDSKEDREDLFQEIVFQLWKAYPSFREDAKISSWMYRIALNTAIAVFRKSRVKIDHQASIPEELHPYDVEESSDNEELMYWALKKLDSSEKAIISLYLEGLSYQEIGEITGISENYVGVRINRIKDKLKLILKPV